MLVGDTNDLPTSPRNRPGQDDMTAHCTVPIHIDNRSSSQVDHCRLAPVIAWKRGPFKTQGRGAAAVRALAAIDVDFDRGERTAHTSAMGASASTLTHCMAGGDRS